ncbi:50S ribosomal protein L11 methyltransferase [Lacticaseibacillus brantae]|nr:50S ribosomal protein L11 methyltransferase [Lacticaseibacillus brantae]
MEWSKISVQTSTEAVEAVSNYLMSLGAEGIQIEDAADFQNEEFLANGVWLDPDTFAHQEEGAKVTGFFNAKTHLPELVPEIQSKVAQLADFGLDPGAGTVSVDSVADDDWANTWKQYYHPVRVSHDLTIVPSWETYQPQQPNEMVIQLDPGMAFGTGTHPTTQLMLTALETLMRGSERVIDVGTGSGVLAIAAEMLGASHILATDVDQVAVDNAKMNLAFNPVTKIDVIANDLLEGIDEKADLILANILAEVLLPLIPQLDHALAKRGQVVLSGIFYDKVAPVKQALATNGFIVRAESRLGDWSAIVAHRQSDEEDA